jgi:hypothetical protein
MYFRQQGIRFVFFSAELAKRDLEAQRAVATALADAENAPQDMVRLYENSCQRDVPVYVSMCFAVSHLFPSVFF